MATDRDGPTVRGSELLIALPIDSVLDEIGAGLEEKGAVALRAPTGAGKTTRVPPFVLRAAPDGQVVVVEPRRVAARAAASRVAEENGWKLGQEVGYRIRFENRSRSSTRVLFVTEGVLLAWLQRDPFLDGVGAVVFDEFHERSLASDLGLAMVERVRRTVRDDLRLVVMSATLEVEPIRRYLADCAAVESEGRTHPVEVDYLTREDERPAWIQATSVVRREIDSTSGGEQGDVLVFLPGVGEIRRVAEELGADLEARGVNVESLFGDLPIDRQQRVLQSTGDGRRRVVLATNVAETSVTVQGVTTVVDTGLERRLQLDPATGFDRLELRPISKSAAKQRAGRAGRERPGRCLRLWTASQNTQRLEVTQPEIQRIDLAMPILRLIAWGESDPLKFPWFEAPDEARVAVALELLRSLGAIESDGTRHRATEAGGQMVRLGCHPRVARVLLDSASGGWPRRGARLAALLEERDVFQRAELGSSVATCRSDVLERLVAVERYERGGRPDRRLLVDRAKRVVRVADQLERELERVVADGGAEPEGKRRGQGGGSDELLLRSLFNAFADRLARRRTAPTADGRKSDRAVLVGGRGVRLASSSGVREAALLVALDVGRATAAVGSGRSGPAPREALVFQASEVDEDWLSADDVIEERVADWDEEVGRVRARRVRRFRDLVLEEVDLPAREEERTGALVAAASRSPERFLDVRRASVVQLLARLDAVRAWRPELELPEISTTQLVELLPSLCAGVKNLAQLQGVDLVPPLLTLLSWPQRQSLEQLAPEQVELANGKKGRLRYGDGDVPILAMRIQQLFGVTQTPKVDGGRRPVLLHLLAPNQRPQQVTDDLAGFWSGSYKLVKKELAGRYPKHPWPDDPANAEPR